MTDSLTDEQIAEIEGRLAAHDKTGCGSWPQKDELDLFINAPTDIRALLDEIGRRDTEKREEFAFAPTLEGKITKIQNEAREWLCDFDDSSPPLNRNEENIIYLLDQIAERDAEIARLRKHWETSTENARWFADKAEASHDEYPGEALGRESMKKWKLNSERCKVCGASKADCPGWHMEGNTKVYHSYGDYCD